MNTKTYDDNERKIITSENNEELAKKIEETSLRILEENYELYKDLENK